MDSYKGFTSHQTDRERNMLGRADLTVSFNGIVTETVITDELIGFKKHRKRKSTKLAPNMCGEEICFCE